MTPGRGLALALLVLACLAGCGRMTPHSRTVEKIRVMLKPGDYDRLAYVQGEDCVGRYAILFRLTLPGVPGRMACDLHPRASNDGRGVAIDSPPAGGGRQVDLIDVGAILEGSDV